MSPLSKVRRLTALKLRGEGKTQAKAAALVGVARRTVDEWESNTSNVNYDNACIPEAPDLRSRLSITLRASPQITCSENHPANGSGLICKFL